MSLICIEVTLLSVRAAKSRFKHPSRGRQAKNLYIASKKLTLSCRMAWAWSERATLHNQQTVILSSNTKHMHTQALPVRSEVAGLAVFLH